MDGEEKDEDSDAGRGCRGCISKEFRCQSICPTHERTELFIDSQWTLGRISLTYLIYRISVAVLVIAWATADFFDEAGRWYSFNYAIWFVFATNWSLLFLCASCVAMAASTAYYYARFRCGYSEERDVRMQTVGCGLRFQWILYNIASNGAFVVSISYWAFVIIIDGSGFLTTPMSQLKHTLNTVFVVVDVFVNAVPVRVLHLVYPLVFGVVYAIFNAVYFINDGLGPDGRPYAYYVLDWRNPLGSAVTCFLGLILCTLVQGVLYGLYRVRIWFHGKLTSRIDEELLDRAVVLDKSGGTDDVQPDEGDSIFPNNLNRQNYRAVDDLELRPGSRD